MMVTHFDPAGDLIVVPGRVWGRGASHDVRFAVDTGAGRTQIEPWLLQSIGYTEQHREARTVVRSVVGEERGFLVRVARLHVLGVEVENFAVHAMRLPQGWDIEGLLGLDFLRYFRYCVHSDQGYLLVEPIP